jgi:ABC-type transport system involved in multi-copper enzyme maturation permease subunit
MSSDTIVSATEAAPVERGPVGFLDLTCLVWRQHRWLIGGTVVAALVLFGTMLVNDAQVTGQNFYTCRAACGGSILGVFGSHSAVGDLQATFVAAFGLVIAVFWAAPLIAREYEQRTNLLAWSQDVSPLRWLVGKVVPMVVVAVGVAVALGTAVILLGHKFHSLEPVEYPPFSGLRFEQSVPLQVAYALFGFALGLLASAVLRRPDVEPR